MGGDDVGENCCALTWFSAVRVGQPAEEDAAEGAARGMTPCIGDRRDGTLHRMKNETANATYVLISLELRDWDGMGDKAAVDQENFSAQDTINLAPAAAAEESVAELRGERQEEREVIPS